MMYLLNRNVAIQKGVYRCRQVWVVGEREGGEREGEREGVRERGGEREREGGRERAEPSLI